MDILQKEAGYQRLEDVLEPEMVKQYQLRRGKQCIYMPLFGKERYLCSCGTVNPMGENCYVCGLAPEPLTREVMEELSREAEARLAAEARERAAREEKRRAHEEARRREKQKKKLIKIALLTVSTLAAVALAVLVFWFSTREWIPAGNYRGALQALEDGDYSRAHRLFTLAGGYQDAEEYLAHIVTPTLTQWTDYGYATNRVEYTYDAAGNRLIMSQEDYGRDLNGERVMSDKQTWINHYNEQGLPVQLEDFYAKTVYTYNERGDVMTEEKTRSDGTPETLRYYSYIYDDMGRLRERAEICSELISVNYSYEQTDTYTYDDLGRVLTRTSRANYPAAIEGNHITVTTNTYDDRGRLAERRMEVTTPNDDSGDCEILEQWTYTRTGKLTGYTRVTSYFGDTSRNSSQVTTTAYNDRGDVVEERISTLFPSDSQRDSLQITAYTYDREGRLIGKTRTQRFSDEMRQNQGGYEETAEYSYDLLGRLTGTKTVYRHADPDSSYAQTETFTYRWDGSRKTGRQTVKSVDGSAVVTEYTYNENSLVETSRTKDGDTETVQEYTYAYFYAPDGTEGSSG